jgi:hypothetical protein
MVPALFAAFESLLLCAFVIAAPGWALARCFFRGEPPATFAAAAIAFGLFVPPVVAFSAAMVLRTNVTPALVIAAALAVTAAGAAGAAAKRAS